MKSDNKNGVHSDGRGGYNGVSGYSGDQYHPARGGYNAPGGGYVPPTDEYNNGYKPPGGGYNPPRGGYKPPGGGHKPSHGEYNNGYKPPSGGYNPPGGEHHPPHSEYKSSHDEYNNGYKPPKGGNRGRGQIYPDGNKSNNKVYNAAAAGIVSKIIRKEKGGYKITITDASEGRQVVDIIPPGPELLVFEGESIKFDQPLTSNSNVGRFG
ncbi:Cytochrome f [Capsicum baccatum]|uniref:Cytochrome f n=1 Tax=Capsicum baccatum TaxID=33114 RepID=A0A2G2W2F2_CAPBA|nr:Cytochrome f [Capsicum baccatum]